MRLQTSNASSLLLLAPLLLPATRVAAADFPARSTFDTGNDGWSYPVSAEWRNTGGNPGGMLFGALDSDPDNITPVASASPSFLGDWSALDNVGALSFDYRKFARGGGNIVAYFPLSVTLSGPGGAASWTGPTPTDPTDWFSVVAPVRAADWSVSAGSWTALLQNVTQLHIQVELESSTEAPDDKAGIDNVTLTLLGDANVNGRIDRDDFALTDRGASKHLTGWTNGDFNGDGAVNQQDYLILDHAFATQSPGASPTPVPEPSICALIACPAILRRRRQRAHSL